MHLAPKDFHESLQFIQRTLSKSILPQTQSQLPWTQILLTVEGSNPRVN